MMISTMMMTITLITTLGIMVIMLTYDDAGGAESSEFPIVLYAI